MTHEGKSCPFNPIALQTEWPDQIEFWHSGCIMVQRVAEWHNWAVVTCDFQQCGILTNVDTLELVQSPVRLRNSKWYSFSSLTVIEYSLKATSKSSDQTAHMRRLIWAFDGCTYHIVVNPMLRLNYCFCLIWFFMSQSTIFQLCQEGSSWVEPVLSKD